MEKFESGAMKLDISTFAPSELVDSAFAQVNSLAKNKKLTLIQSVASNATNLNADFGKLRRTLVNLLGNAIKFTPEGGVVTANVEKLKSAKGESVVFSVSDTGEGIPPEAFGRIFEKFGQVESSQGGRSIGTGLGLTFCKLTVEAHGGCIKVESVPSQGSTFSFGIPC